MSLSLHVLPRWPLDPSYKRTRIDADHSPMASYPDLLLVLDPAGLTWLEYPAAEALAAELLHAAGLW